MNKILALAICSLLSACSTVSNMTVSEDLKPWEKSLLAQPGMQFPQDKMINYSDQHIFFSKEASTGGTSVGGGGCGCN